MSKKENIVTNNELTLPNYDQVVLDLFTNLTYQHQSVHAILKLLKDTPWTIKGHNDPIFEALAYRTSEHSEWSNILQTIVQQKKIQWDASYLPVLEYSISHGKGDIRCQQYYRYLKDYLTNQDLIPLLALTLKHNYKNTMQDLLKDIGSVDLTSITTNDNPFYNVQTHEDFKKLIAKGFRVTDESLDHESGADVIRTRDRTTSFESFRERDLILKDLLEIEKTLPAEDRFLIGIRNAKKLPDIQLVLKSIGPEWTQLRIGPNQLHPLYFIFKYQQDYVDNVLERKDVRTLGSSWISESLQNGIPAHFAAWTQPSTARGYWRQNWKAVPELNWAQLCQNHPELSLHIPDPELELSLTTPNPTLEESAVSYTIQAFKYLESQNLPLIFDLPSWIKYALQVHTLPGTPLLEGNDYSQSYQKFCSGLSRQLLKYPECMAWIEEQITRQSVKDGNVTLFDFSILEPHNKHPWFKTIALMNLITNCRNSDYAWRQKDIKEGVTQAQVLINKGGDWSKAEQLRQAIDSAHKNEDMMMSQGWIEIGIKHEAKVLTQALDSDPEVVTAAPRARRRM